MLATGEHLRLSVYHEPDLVLARAANAVGYDAWLQRFVRAGRRTEAQLRHVFNPGQPERLLPKMREAAKIRRLAGAVATVGDGESSGWAGSIWGADDVSGTELLRPLKRAQGKEY